MLSIYSLDCSVHVNHKLNDFFRISNVCFDANVVHGKFDMHVEKGILFQSYLSIGYHDEKNEATPLLLEPFILKEHLSCH